MFVLRVQLLKKNTKPKQIPLILHDDQSIYGAKLMLLSLTTAIFKTSVAFYKYFLQQFLLNIFLVHSCIHPCMTNLIIPDTAFIGRCDKRPSRLRNAFKQAHRACRKNTLDFRQQHCGPL